MKRALDVQTPSAPLTVIWVDDQKKSVMARHACIAITPLNGVHRGHRRVIAAAQAHARRLGVPLAVLTFAPVSPQTGDDEFSQLMSVDQQARILESMGVEILYIFRADHSGANLEGEAFAASVLTGKLQARHITLGLEPSPSAESLSSKLIRNSSAHEFSISLINGLPADGSGFDPHVQALDALKTGRPEIAANILQRPFAIEGMVVEGQKLGRQLGFPTANVSAGQYVRPRFGAYATRTRLPDGREFPGVANFGVNPTTGRVDARLEVHLFEFNEDIYGQIIETEIIGFLRPEAEFNSIDELITQIARDADAARLLLNHRPKLAVVGT